MESCLDFDLLYKKLTPRAEALIMASFKGESGMPRQEIQSYAHDIVVDFLFFSRSFQYFKEEIGELMPFFSSYVRKKCLRLRDNIIISNHRFFRKSAIWEECMELDMDSYMSSDKFEWWVEFESVVKHIRSCLSKFEVSGLNLGRVFVADLVLTAVGEPHHLHQLCELFGGVSKAKMKNAVKVMKARAKVYGYVPQNFYRSFAPTRAFTEGE